MAKKKTANMWNTVTPLSKAIAMGMFVILPFVGFYIGVQYQKAITPISLSPDYTPARQMVQPGGPMKPAQGKLCTQEAKQCPDGSYVGRTGPNCEFASCQ